MGVGMVDDDRTCIACATPALATPSQVAWPRRVEQLRREAAQLEGRAKALRSEAATLAAAAKAEPIPAYLCAGCRQHLHDPWLAKAWGGGIHDATDLETIERTLAYVTAEEHKPGAKGSCLDCKSPGRQHEEQTA
jgi:hypothetical protein